MKNTKTAGTKATIYDIAKLAGVNASTVSRALGRPDRVSARTQKLVQDAAAKLNFTMNPVARALPTGRTSTIGLIVADITNPSYFDIIRGAQTAAAARNYTLILAESAESSSTEVTVAKRMQPATDGIILASPRMTDPDIIALNGAGHVTVINRCVEGIESVVPDASAGIGEAVRHLALHGHRTIAFLAGPDQSWASGRRWVDLKAAAEWTRRQTHFIPTLAPTVEGGRRAARDVISSGATAAICYNDLLAIGLMQELQAASVQIPQDFSVVGFDNIFGSDFTTPALTTIASPFSECGAVALGRLLVTFPATGNSRASGGGAPLRTTLVVRGSTGPAPARAT